MSMLCYLGALTQPQMDAFRAEPTLASQYVDFIQNDEDQSSRLSAMPADMRQQYEAARAALQAQFPGAKRESGRETANSKLDRLRPFASPLDLHKSWHVLHYAFTGHAWDAAAPGDSLLTGLPLGEDVGYGPPRLHDAGEVRTFSDFMAPLTSERLTARLNPEEMERLQIYSLPHPFDDHARRMLGDEVAAYFPPLKAYVQSAAAMGQGLLIWLS